MKNGFVTKLISTATSCLIITSLFAFINTPAYATTPGCDTNATGIVEVPTNVSSTLDIYSVWLNISGTKQVDIGVDIDNTNCIRVTASLASTNYNWIKVGSNFSAVAGQRTIRIHSYSNGFSFTHGALISDNCIPTGDGSNCSSVTITSSTTTTSTPTTTTRPLTTTTTSTTTTTTTRPVTTNPISAPSNITTQVHSCWWLWCSVTARWSPSTGGNGNISYRITADIRSAETTNSTTHTLIWLPKGKTYPIKIQAIDSSGKTSEAKTIYCNVS